jgi:hypothetical protein
MQRGDAVSVEHCVVSCAVQRTFESINPDPEILETRILNHQP